MACALNLVMKLGSPYNARNSLTLWETTSLSKTLLRGVRLSPFSTIFIFFVYICVYWFQPLLTIWVYHGVLTELFALGCFKDVYSLSHFTTYLLSTGQYLNGTLGVFTNLVSLGILLKCLEDTSEEACDVWAILVLLTQTVIILTLWRLTTPIGVLPHR